MRSRLPRAIAPSWAPLWLAVSLTTVLPACAEDPALRNEVTDMKKRLDEAQRRQADSDKKLVEMEDRVFLLTDQIESQKVAQNRGAPRLPIVTLRPADEPTEDAEGTVEYRGDAAKTGDPATVRSNVHFQENAVLPTRHRSQAIPTATVPLPSSREAMAARPAVSTGDNLGVANAPDVAKVLRSPSAAVASASDDPVKLYRAALDELKAGRHDVAAQRLRELVKRFPRHDYADNAQYWLGECFYDRKRYAEAAVEFQKVVTVYPTGNKAPDALLKLGLSAVGMGDPQKGAEVLRSVPSAYPGSDAARVAEERLRELREGKK